MTDGATVAGDEDNRAWGKALAHLAESAAMDPGTTPTAVVHSAYYAMHHAARAVLLRHDGERAPTRHGSVIGRFGQVAKDDQPPDVALLQAGRDINRIYEERLEADYDVGERTDEGTARNCLDRATNFLNVCARRFGFPPP